MLCNILSNKYIVLWHEKMFIYAMVQTEGTPAGMQEEIIFPECRKYYQ